MKKYIALTLCIALCACLFAACKKEPPAPTETDTSAEVQTDGTTTAESTESSETESTEIPDETEISTAPAEEKTDGKENESEGTADVKKFLGTYINNAYTVNVEQAPDGELTFTVTDKPDDSVGYEWTITGFYNGDTYRVNYSDAVKTKITYNENGTEAGRETVYGNGIGRMQFTDDGALLWENENEAEEGRIVLYRLEG